VATAARVAGGVRVAQRGGDMDRVADSSQYILAMMFPSTSVSMIWHTELTGFVAHSLQGAEFKQVYRHNILFTWFTLKSLLAGPG
jgi:hypothetical protein